MHTCCIEFYFFINSLFLLKYSYFYFYLDILSDNFKVEFLFQNKLILGFMLIVSLMESIPQENGTSFPFKS